MDKKNIIIPHVRSSITFSKLVAGFSENCTREETTIIREYVDHKSRFGLPKKIGTDAFMEKVYFNGDIIYQIVNIIEITKVKNIDIDFKKLIEFYTGGDSTEDQLHKYIYSIAIKYLKDFL